MKKAEMNKRIVRVKRTITDTYRCASCGLEFYKDSFCFTAEHYYSGTARAYFCPACLIDERKRETLIREGLRLPEHAEIVKVLLSYKKSTAGVDFNLSKQRQYGRKPKSEED
jgi:hypothetical protein